MPECPLCDRAVDGLTRHHLEPKRRKESDVVEICEPCHDQIHAVFTHHELRQRYDSLEALRESDAIQRFVAWLRDHDPDTVDVDSSERVREWRD